MTRNLSDTCYHRKTKYTKAQAEAIILEKASSFKLYLYECGICGACHLSKQKPRDLPAGGPDCSGSELSSPADGVDLPIASSPDSVRSSLNNSIDAEFSEMATDEPYRVEATSLAGAPESRLREGLRELADKWDQADDAFTNSMGERCATELRALLSQSSDAGSSTEAKSSQ